MSPIAPATRSLPLPDVRAFEGLPGTLIRLPSFETVSYSIDVGGRPRKSGDQPRRASPTSQDFLMFGGDDVPDAITPELR